MSHTVVVYPFVSTLVVNAIVFAYLAQYFQGFSKSDLGSEDLRSKAYTLYLVFQTLFIIVLVVLGIMVLVMLAALMSPPKKR